MTTAQKTIELFRGGERDKAYALYCEDETAKELTRDQFEDAFILIAWRKTEAEKAAKAVTDAERRGD
jgi:hypothetical protein